MKNLCFFRPKFSPIPVLLWLIACATFANLSVFLMTGCKKQTDDLMPPTTVFEQKAKDFVAKAALPLSLANVALESEAPKDSLTQLARRIVEEMVILKAASPAGKATAKKFREQNLSAATLDAYIAGFLANGFLQSGDHIVRFNWKTNTGIEFFTLGTMAPDGTPRFEPILHFNGIETIDSKAATDRDWSWGPWKRTVTNGFDCNCVEVEWTVKIVTSPDGCNIVDPGPHIEITKQVSNCWAWEQQTTKGETMWCNPEEDCHCSVSPSAFGEDCIKWAVVTYVATGASNVQVEAGAGAEYKGVKLESKISFDSSRWGAEATYETIRNLCAKSGSTHN
ncbi:MAG: hypothetical protein JNJ90_05770 [Saprospiraceae bacterium]|nr:hypothetical protein [Saprospiraceae bacterium]